MTYYELLNWDTANRVVARNSLAEILQFVDEMIEEYGSDVADTWVLLKHGTDPNKSEVIAEGLDIRPKLFARTASARHKSQLQDRRRSKPFRFRNLGLSVGFSVTGDPVSSIEYASLKNDLLDQARGSEEATRLSPSFGSSEPRLLAIQLGESPVTSNLVAMRRSEYHIVDEAFITLARPSVRFESVLWIEADFDNGFLPSGVHPYEEKRPALEPNSLHAIVL